jgi:hypothetical protein
MSEVITKIRESSLRAMYEGVGYDMELLRFSGYAVTFKLSWLRR